MVLAASKETYSQRRRLPMETFRVFVEAEAVQEPRPAQGATWIQRCKRGDLEKRPVTNSFVQTGALIAGRDVHMNAVSLWTDLLSDPLCPCVKRITKAVKHGKTVQLNMELIYPQMYINGNKN